MLASGLIVNAAATLLRAPPQWLEVLTDGEWPLGVDALPAVMLEAGREEWQGTTIHGPLIQECTLTLSLTVEQAGDTCRTDASTNARRCLERLFGEASQGTAFPWSSFRWTGEVTVERSLRTTQERLVASETFFIRCSYMQRMDQPGQPL